MKIGTLEVGAGHPCRIVAELSNNWRTADTPAVPGDADRDRLGRLIDAAQAAGADAIKVQCYQASEIVALRGNGPAPEPWGSQGWDMAALYAHAATPFEWFPKIKAHCERVGIPWFSSVFGPQSLALLESLNCPAYKISHFEADNLVLANACRDTGKPLLLSYGSSMGIAWADLHVWCPGGYPAQPADMQLGARDVLRALSSHCLDPLVAPVAVARGAKLLEYHFMLDDEPSALESNVSLTASQFAGMVQSVRATEVLLGDS